MALIHVPVMAGVFTTPQKEENIEEVPIGEWGIGGPPLTADDVRALARATSMGSEPR